MAFIATIPMKLMTTQKIVVKICTKCYPNPIKSIENTGKISFMSLSEALPSCTNFHVLANVKRHYADILCCKLHLISQEIFKLQEKEFNYTPG
jgi:hypothetical protein